MDKEPKISVEYLEVDLNSVMQYFIKGFQLKDREIWNWETFIDTNKNKVVFKLITKENN